MGGAEKKICPEEDRRFSFKSFPPGTYPGLTKRKTLRAKKIEKLKLKKTKRKENMASQR